MSLFGDQSIDTSLSYELALKRLAVESIGSNSSFLVFKDFIPKSVELLKSFVPDLTKLSTSAPITAIPSQVKDKERRDLIIGLRKTNFITYEDTLVPVPEGFNGKLIPYMQLLLSQASSLIDDGQKVIQDYSTQLSMFLSMEDSRKSVKSNSAYYRAVRDVRNSLQKEQEKFFNKNALTLSRQKISHVMDRFGDLEEIFLLEEKLLKIRKQQNYAAILSEVNKAADILTLIRGRIDAGDITDMSSVVASNLAEGAHEVAKYVEYIAINGYYVETCLGAVRNMSDQLTRVFLK